MREWLLLILSIFLSEFRVRSGCIVRSSLKHRRISLSQSHESISNGQATNRDEKLGDYFVKVMDFTATPPSAESSKHVAEDSAPTAISQTPQAIYEPETNLKVNTGQPRAHLSLSTGSYQRSSSNLYLNDDQLKQSFPIGTEEHKVTEEVNREFDLPVLNFGDIKNNPQMQNLPNYVSPNLPSHSESSALQKPQIVTRMGFKRFFTPESPENTKNVNRVIFKVIADGPEVNIMDAYA